MVRGPKGKLMVADSNVEASVGLITEPCRGQKVKQNQALVVWHKVTHLHRSEQHSDNHTARQSYTCVVRPDNVSDEL